MNTSLTTESQPVPTRERKAIFGGLSLLVFAMAIGGCVAMDAYFPHKPGPDHMMDHFDLFLMDIVLGGILGGTLGLIGLIRGERPRLLGIIGLILNLLPVLGLVFFCVKLRSV
jgi:hypothetical protein